ncbi:hypothetical protein CLV36_10228 [Laceyella sediminis]|uniref:Helix-turn-helix protein n=1 Tax=Laceyella sediminis TaxID=573074 RepID=A0ABX5EUQ9_9BACL|nr:hypothetical protein [Laceyella sediminis]PRZ16320.1 hypothetical protein CLV36_10228 [Laceyella sediminis]
MANETVGNRIKERLNGRSIPKQRVYDKTKEKESIFFRLPKEIEHYVYIPEFRPEMIYLYALISDYYNSEEGYAFPSVGTLSIRYGRNEGTTRQHLKVLQAVGLLEITHREGYSSIYRPLYPLKEADFYGVFPEAMEERKKAETQVEKERQRSKAKRKFRSVDNQESVVNQEQQPMTLKEMLDWL